MYPGTFVEALKKHLPDTPLKCNQKKDRNTIHWTMLLTYDLI